MTPLSLRNCSNSSLVKRFTLSETMVSGSHVKRCVCRRLVSVTLVVLLLMIRCGRQYIVCASMIIRTCDPQIRSSVVDVNRMPSTTRLLPTGVMVIPQAACCIFDIRVAVFHMTCNYCVSNTGRLLVEPELSRCVWKR